MHTNYVQIVPKRVKVRAEGITIKSVIYTGRENVCIIALDKHFKTFLEKWVNNRIDDNAPSPNLFLYIAEGLGVSISRMRPLQKNT